MSLKDEILAGGFDLAHRDDGAIAAALSTGRKKTVPTVVGVGAVLETLGLAVGTQFLDVVYGTAAFRYVVKLLDTGMLRVDSPVTVASVQAMVPGVLSQVQADALLNLAKVPDVVTAQQVADALEGM
jgi:hypothetical protein